MTTSDAVFRADDIVEAVQRALENISHTHSQDFIDALTRAYEREESVPAKSALAQIIQNSRLASEAKRPMCQDTGLMTAFVDVGIHAKFDEQTSDIESVVNEGIRRASGNKVSPLRSSVVRDPIGARQNTGDNTPGVVHTRIVPGEGLTIRIAAKGGGSENRAAFAVLGPADDWEKWVIDTVRRMGAGWCPPGVLGIGVGGSSEQAMIMAKRALYSSIDIHDINSRGPTNEIECTRLRLFKAINQLGIGTQGLGGRTTVLDVKLETAATHAASLPIAIVPNCVASRHTTIQFDTNCRPRLQDFEKRHWPKLSSEGRGAKSIDLDSLSRADVSRWRAGERLSICGTLIVMRDKAHEKLSSDSKLEELGSPIDLQGKVIYYSGPAPAAGSEVLGPAGPTTAARMDRFTEQFFDEFGVLAMIGKAERSEQVRRQIATRSAAYLTATGGAAYLLSKSIKAAKIIAYPELGMEAIHEIVVRDMPVTVAIDCEGSSIFEIGPARWGVSKIRASDIGLRSESSQDCTEE